MATNIEAEIDQKVNEALAKLGTTADSIKGSIAAYKGHFTRELENLDEELKLADEADPTLLLIQRINEAKYRLDFRYKLINQCYSTLVKLFPTQSDEAVRNEEEIYRRYMRADRATFKTLNHVEYLIQSTRDEMEMETNKTINQGNNRHILRAAADLKPEKIDSSVTPLLFLNWCQRFATYFRANGLLDQTIAEQKEFAMELVSETLWNNIQGNLSDVIPVVRIDNNGRPIINNNVNQQNRWTFLDHLNDEFKRIHPILTRRLEVLKFKQSNQGTLTFLAELEKHVVASDLDNMTHMQLKLSLAVNGIKSEKLRIEVLKAMQNKLKNPSLAKWYLVTSLDHNKANAAINLQESSQDYLKSDVTLALNKCLHRDVTEWEPQSEITRQYRDSLLEREQNIKNSLKEKFKNIYQFHEVMASSPLEHVEQLCQQWEGLQEEM